MDYLLTQKLRKSTFENLDLDMIQLHGEENVKFIKELKKVSNKTNY